MMPLHRSLPANRSILKRPLWLRDTGKGGEDYVNCPMDEGEYYRFVEALNQGERVAVRDFERRYLFEGCLPVEELAERGKDTLAFGPMKPVGLVDPENGKTTLCRCAAEA